MAVTQVKAIATGTFSWNVDVPAQVAASQRIGSITSYKVIIPVWAPVAGWITFRQPGTVVYMQDLLFTIDSVEPPSTSSPVAAPIT